MELPQLGKQCAISDCKQLDFLPFECDLCKGIYCKDHMSPLQHGCKEFKDNELQEKPATTSIVSYKCSQCTALDQVEMLCEHCAQHFCVSHRFHACHEVETNKRKQLREQWKIPKEQFRQAKLVADKQVEQKLSKAEVTPESRPLALKLRLMKLKAKAAGDHRVPPVDRVYFNCAAPRPDPTLDIAPVNPNTPVIRCKAVYVSKCWSIGKCLDVICAQLKVSARNGGARLYKSDGTRVDRGDLSELLSEIIKHERVYSGENLIVERGLSERLDSLEGYEFIV